MMLDFGGIVKEYAVDTLLGLARDYAIEDVIVDLGQDLRVSGQSPEDDGAWRIGIEDTVRAGHCVCGVRIQDQAVATSGDCYRHVVIEGKRYGHILDLRTGYPADNACRTVTVLAPTCVQAGVWAKAVLILGPEAGLVFLERHEGAAGCIIMNDGTRWDSARFARHLLP